MNGCPDLALPSLNGPLRMPLQEGAKLLIKRGRRSIVVIGPRHLAEPLRFVGRLKELSPQVKGNKLVHRSVGDEGRPGATADLGQAVEAASHQPAGRQPR